LTNFSNDKQTQESLKSDFSKSKFQKTNIHDLDNSYRSVGILFSKTKLEFMQFNH
jgi:hypothetical protein